MSKIGLENWRLKKRFEQTKRKKNTPPRAGRERKHYFIVVKLTQGTTMFDLARYIHVVLSREGYYKVNPT